MFERVLYEIEMRDIAMNKPFEAEPILPLIFKTLFIFNHFHIYWLSCWCAQWWILENYRVKTKEIKVHRKFHWKTLSFHSHFYFFGMKLSRKCCSLNIILFFPFKKHERRWMIGKALRFKTNLPTLNSIHYYYFTSFCAKKV
jgi:hypothetical protein